MNEKNSLPTVARVVQGDYCVGCGACGVASAQVRLVPRVTGGRVAQLDNALTADLDQASAVCPFADESLSEDALAREAFPGASLDHPVIGRHVALYAGRIRDEAAITGSSSGGLTSWVIEQLLARGEVDGVVHLVEGEGGAGDLFRFGVSTSIEEVRRRGKSKYYAADFAEVVSAIRGDGRRYVFVGVPCYVKAMRLLCRQDATLAAQFPLMLALICGHMKSPAFAELLAWQVGVRPSELTGVDFRVKVPGEAASRYAFSALDRDGQAHSRTSRDLIGGNWGHATFQLRACDFCDDIFGECADIAFGDAWLSRFNDDWRGTNIVVVRNPALRSLLVEGAAAIELEPLSQEDALKTQAGNVRHRRDGLSVRLADARACGEWAPTKRVPVDAGRVPPRRRAIVRLRSRMAATSHEAFAEAKRRDDLDYYRAQLDPLAREMERLSRETFTDRLQKRVRSWFSRLRRRR